MSSCALLVHQDAENNMNIIGGLIESDEQKILLNKRNKLTKILDMFFKLQDSSAQQLKKTLS